jgi:hypothetical protein
MLFMANLLSTPVKKINLNGFLLAESDWRYHKWSNEVNITQFPADLL